MRYIGIDCGGTNLRVYEVNPKTGDLTDLLIDMKTRKITDNQTLTEKIYEAIKPLGPPEQICVGASAAGTIDEEELIVTKATNFPTIREEITFARELAAKKYKVALTNDLKAAGIGAIKYAQGKGIPHGAIVTFSSGHNYSVWHNGKLNDEVIEGGHMSYKPGSGVFCGCGEEGHLEPYVSGNGAVGMAKQALIMQGTPHHTILEEAVREIDNEQITQERFERLKEDLNYRRTIFNKITARNVFAAYRRKPDENPQKEIRDLQIQAIPHSFGEMISNHSPLEIIICMGSQATKDWETLFEPAIELYKKRPGKYHHPNLKVPEIVMNTEKKIGAKGAVAYFLLKNPSL